MNSDQKLERILRILNDIRRVDASISLTAATLFIQVAYSPGIPFQDVSRLLGMSPSSVSRNVALLGRRRALGKKLDGLGLVESELDGDCYRQKNVWLSTKGSGLVDRLLALWNGEDLPEPAVERTSVTDPFSILPGTPLNLG